MTRKLSCTAILFATVAGLALLPAAALADGPSEITNGAAHAGLAAGSLDVAGVHTHLHHALNCLVGPGGKGFDAKEMNPCAQAGSGAIPDTADATKKAALEVAADASLLVLEPLDATDTQTMLKAQE